MTSRPEASGHLRPTAVGPTIHRVIFPSPVVASYAGRNLFWLENYWLNPTGYSAAGASDAGDSATDTPPSDTGSDGTSAAGAGAAGVFSTIA